MATQTIIKKEPTGFLCSEVWTPLVLVVDDDITSRELLHDYLNEIGCRSISAVDGAEALVLIEKAPGSIGKRAE